MSIRTLTPEEEAAKELKEKRVYDLIKEGKTLEEAKAIIEAAKVNS